MEPVSSSLMPLPHRSGSFEKELCYTPLNFAGIPEDSAIQVRSLATPLAG
jgi:hypothetical protein